MGKMLFPEHLNKGSRGSAVALLQVILKAGGCDEGDKIVVDGEYGDNTAQAVKEFQEQYGVEVDGNFGPETREALRREWKLNVNALSADLFVGETVVTPS